MEETAMLWMAWGRRQSRTTSCLLAQAQTRKGRAPILGDAQSVFQANFLILRKRPERVAARTPHQYQAALSPFPIPSQL